MNEIKQSKPNRSIDFAKLYGDLKKHRRLYYRVLPITFVVAAILMWSVPNYYTCSVELSPELSNRSSSSSSLASLASSFGVNLGSGMGRSSDALFPTLYPDLMASVDFRASLFKVKVKPKNSAQEYTYYDYIKDVQKEPWWGKLVKAFFGIFKSDEKEKEINPRHLTKKQTTMAKALGKRITCQVDKKTMVITISVKDNDPDVCTTMVDSTMMLLQQYITDYRTKKARVDLNYYRKMSEEAKAKYEHAARVYAEFADANLNSFQERVRQKRSELETEMTLQRSVYQQVVAQQKQAEMKVQEETPAFAVIQASTTPAKKAGPKRAQSCLVFLFLAFLATSVYVLHKEGDLKMLLGIS